MFRTLFTCLAALLAFAVLSSGNPLHARDGGLTITKDSPPAGYTFSKLILNTEVNGQKVQVEGDDREVS